MKASGDCPPGVALAWDRLQPLSVSARGELFIDGTCDLVRDQRNSLA